MKLRNKVAIITGASRGIGAATAKLFAGEGAKLVLDYYVSEYEPDALVNVTRIKDEIEKAGGQVIAFEADVANELAVKSLMAAAIKEYGQIDVLINNAGIAYDVKVSERTLEQWHRTIDTNLLGVYLCAKYASSHMLERSTGKIINLASTSGIDAFNPESIDYDASKAGIITITKNFAKMLAPFVNVNAVAPGWVDTELNKDLPEEFIEREVAKSFLKRFARPEEIAQIILFLASDDASYINGEVIVADGGRGY